ncbi:MAG TPA: PDZ domain-containing protein [Thermoanaerobaculia bacterium]|jgi:predicted metalloprotease with PDZ domain|nr:PDZ domain-containing protein [Thermoanaerobaculia bacterium]
MTAPIRHTLRFAAPESHYLEVESSFPAPADPAAGLELSMAVWTPGSYLIREYSRHVEAISAEGEGGRPLPIAKTRKNRWRVATASSERVIVRYRLYAHDLTVRTNFVEADFALLSGAGTFLVPIDGHHLPAEVRIELPGGWRAAVCPLPRTADGTGFLARDYDQLVDSPLYAGNAEIHRFEVAGREHTLLTEGADERWDGARAAQDVARLVETEAAFWGGLPYERYVVINILAEATGGLEHADSSVLMTNRLGVRRAEGYRDWLGLVAHELFHAWHVKRLRPVEFDRFDYEAEVYTPSLWAIEGVTSYYEELMVARAGFSDLAGLLANLTKTIDTVESGAGRLVQGLDAASFDAWIKYYRKDENFANSGVSYYTRGLLVAFLLDVEIRRATAGARSLDDAIHLAYARHSGAQGFRPEDLVAIFSEIAGRPLGPWLDRALAPGDLDFAPALAWLGLRFAPPRPSPAEPERNRPAAVLGIEADSSSGRLYVAHVVRDGPAARAGVAAGDEILAIDDDRVPPHALSERLRGHFSGEEVSLLVSRRDRLRRLPLVFGERQKFRGSLEVDPAATPEQIRQLASWWRGIPVAVEASAC